VAKKRTKKQRLTRELMSIYVEPLKAKLLRDLSKHTHVPQQVYLREGLDLVLERHRLLTVEVTYPDVKPNHIDVEVVAKKPKVRRIDAIVRRGKRKSAPIAANAQAEKLP
jgi:hypothetical protein